MSTIDDGVIKFDLSDFTRTSALSIEVYQNVEKARHKLFSLKLIGEYQSEKVGYGNISERTQDKDLKFCISGTQTGKYPHLDGSHYTIVTGYDLIRNRISSKGPILPSSESLTHAAIYECNNDIKAVIHIHDFSMWNNMLANNFNHTSKDIPYGTLEMAKATKELVSNTDHGAFAMAGHQDGIVIYSTDMNRALEETLKLYERYHSKM